MFFEWLFLVVIVAITAILLSRIWLQATGQNERPSGLPFLSSTEMPVTSTAFYVADASATAVSRLQDSELSAQVTSSISPAEPLPTPLVLSDTSVLGEAFLGQPAPDFTLATLNGSEITLLSSRGRPVIINFGLAGVSLAGLRHHFWLTLITIIQIAA